MGETRGVGGGVLVLIVTPTGARAIGASAALASAHDTTSIETMARFKRRLCGGVKDMIAILSFKKVRPYGDSNAGFHLRRVTLYPLSYRGG